MNNKLIGIWVIRIVVSLLFLVSAYAKVYHEPSAYFSITTFEAKQLVPLGFSSEISSYLSRILIALEFSIGILILLPVLGLTLPRSSRCYQNSFQFHWCLLKNRPKYIYSFPQR